MLELTKRGRGRLHGAVIQYFSCDMAILRQGFAKSGPGSAESAEPGGCRGRERRTLTHPWGAFALVLALILLGE